MTVSTETASVSYNGDGATVAFTVTFPFQANGDIMVTHRDADGVETEWTENTQYTLTGAGAATGTVTVKTTPTDYTPAASTTLTIQRAMTFTQTTDYVANDPFPAESHEDALDKQMMCLQQLNTDSTLKVRFSSTVSDSPDLELTELAADRASKIMQFNAAGDTLELAAALAGSTILNDDTMGAGTGSTTQATSQDSVYNFTTAEDTKLVDGTTPFTAIDVNGGDIDAVTLDGSTIGTSTIKSDTEFGDATDTTKQVALDISGAATAKTTTLDFNHTDDRTVTFPDEDGTIFTTALLSQSLTTNGHATLPGGMVIQWGIQTGGTEVISETFSLTFPTACFTVVLTQTDPSSPGGGSASNIVIDTDTLSTTGFSVYAQGGGTAVEGFFWIAIGH